MSWHYRVRKRHVPVTDRWGCDESYDEFEIIEAVYNSEGGVVAEMEEAATVFGETVEDLRSTLTAMLAALDQSVIGEP